MSTFIDWITNPYNHNRLHNKNPASKRKSKEIRQEIANIVNSKHKTKWTELQVKSKISYVRAKYREAVNLGSSEPGAQVTIRQLDTCPEFRRLHQVYGDHLVLNPPPPEQPVHFGHRQATSEITDDDESSNFEPQDDTSDADFDAGSQQESSNAVPSNKRQRGNDATTSAMDRPFLEETPQLPEQEPLFYDETATKSRRREPTLEIPEHVITERVLRVMDDMSRFAEEARSRLRQELAAEKAEFRKEMAEERAELKREKAEFASERDQLKMENAALRMELSVRFNR
ncbi:hypothetical protein EC991_000611 [Linnemannia zychae]|nr:hypothetical protein EC991_000611 [Linnemannia zychae]